MEYPSTAHSFFFNLFNLVWYFVLPGECHTFPRVFVLHNPYPSSTIVSVFELLARSIPSWAYSLPVLCLLSSFFSVSLKPATQVHCHTSHFFHQTFGLAMQSAAISPLLLSPSYNLFTSKLNPSPSLHSLQTSSLDVVFYFLFWFIHPLMSLVGSKNQSQFYKPFFCMLTMRQALAVPGLGDHVWLWFLFLACCSAKPFPGTTFLPHLTLHTKAPSFWVLLGYMPTCHPAPLLYAFQISSCCLTWFPLMDCEFPVDYPTGDLRLYA